MDQVTHHELVKFMVPFNGGVEIGLRSLSVLTSAFPALYSLERLVVFDYLLVHSDDVADGPPGLHPQTPYRGGEILVRRGVLQEGLLLYQSRGLVERRYENDGEFFCATDRSAGFLDALGAEYVFTLRDRALWVVERFGSLSDSDLHGLVREQIGDWGAEFAMASVLWADESL